MFKSQASTTGTAIEERPRLPAGPVKLTPRIDRNIMAETALEEYRQVAAEVGISDQDILVEEFRSFLASNDIAVFSYQEVISYMDDVSARDNPTRLGWHWCPVRIKDTKTPMAFGKPSEDRRHYQSNGGIIPASDYYSSHLAQDWHRGASVVLVGAASGGGANVVNVTPNVHAMQAAHDGAYPQKQPRPVDWRSNPSPSYTRTLPLHALKKIAFIEREFKAAHPVFLVTDYTVRADIIVNPDPFLMAVIPNSAVAHGKGRFIIDVWDEPGFGIGRMLK